MADAIDENHADDADGNEVPSVKKMRSSAHFSCFQIFGDFIVQIFYPNPFPERGSTKESMGAFLS
jgi:hypothetical protein